VSPRGKDARLQRWLPLIAGLLAVACAFNPPSVSACGIDGIPSMSVNGRLVSINRGQATKENLAYYAPFLLGVAKPGEELRFEEDAPKLHKALTDQAFATPFQWSFGDGGTAHGLRASHRYSWPGWYKVNVSYYYTPQRRWVVFDSAQLLIPGAPAAQRAGIGAAALIGPAWATALGLGGIALVVGFLRRPRAARTGGSGRRAARGRPAKAPQRPGARAP
jgi:hypothetical protein